MYLEVIGPGLSENGKDPKPLKEAEEFLKNNVTESEYILIDKNFQNYMNDAITLH